MQISFFFAVYFGVKYNSDMFLTPFVISIWFIAIFWIYIADIVYISITQLSKIMMPLNHSILWLNIFYIMYVYCIADSCSRQTIYDFYKKISALLLLFYWIYYCSTTSDYFNLLFVIFIYLFLFPLFCLWCMRKAEGNNSRDLQCIQFEI